MKPSSYLFVKPGRALACIGLGLIALLLAGGLLLQGTAQEKQSAVEKRAPAETPKAPAEAPKTNAPPSAKPESAEKTNGPVAAAAAAAPAAQPGSAPPGQATPAKADAAGSAKPEGDKTSSSDEVQLSLMGANVDMVVQWLAQTTGKSVIKSPKVQCQIMITSSKKLPKREALAVVYRALALEGFTVTETRDVIYITPEGQEPKISPELIDKDIPDGRQRLVKIFNLEHMPAADMKERIRAVLSDKGTIECDDHAKRIIVTDYNDNLRFMAELIKEFDVTSSDVVVEIFPLKYAEAEDVGNIVGLILNVSSASGGGPSRPSPSGGGGGGSPGPSSDSPMPMGMPPGRGGPSPSSSGSGPAASGIGSQITAPLVRIWPDKTSNRLIVSAAKSKISDVRRLVDILDTEKPEDVCVRVIPLKNMTAIELVRELAPLYQKMSGRTRKDAIEIGANDRSNALVILSSEANFKSIEKLVRGLDTEEAQEKVVRTFVLKNADAEDVAKQLQDLSRDQDNSSRYPYYLIFSSSGQDKGRKKMSVVADRRRNSLVIQAPPGQMESIEKMITELDEPITDDSLAPRIYHLKYVSAVDIEDVLNELFLKKTQQRSYYYFFDDYPEQQADRNVGRLYGKVRITSEPYSNSLIITSNSKENMAVIEEVLKQLDVQSEAGESTLRIRLKFAKAPVVANAVNILFAKNGSPPLRQQGQPNQPNQPAPQPQQQQQSQQSVTYLTGFDLQQETKEEGYYPWIGGQPDNLRTSDGRSSARPVSDLVGRVRAVADTRNNALLISASVHFFPQVLKLVEDLDAAADQVLIEARLVEVNSDFLDKLGVRWSPNGNQVFTGDDFDNSIMAHNRGDYTTGFGGQTLANTRSTTFSGNQATTVINGLTSLRSGVLDSTISMDFLIQFLRRTTDAKVIAEPQINIRDNETGRLFVGQQVPVQGQSTFSGAAGAQNTTFVYKPVGIVLEVTPHINSSGDVELQIHTESSTIVPGQMFQGNPLFDTRAFRTDLTAQNGQTLVLGGIIQKQITDTLRKTPILGDIPGLGWAFKKKDKDVRNVELMVFMRPKVTRTPAESQDLLKEIYRKAPAIKDWDEQNQLPADGKPGNGKPDRSKGKRG